MNHALHVQTPNAWTKANLSCQSTPLYILGQKFYADLVVLGKEGLDVILGMNWMAKLSDPGFHNYAIMLCAIGIVTLRVTGVPTQAEFPGRQCH